MTSTSAWDMIVTGTFSEWFSQLDATSRQAVLNGLEVLRLHGPTLGRPYVDTLSGSRHANMKELRVDHEVIRVLFAFDPERRALLLCGGSKRNDKKFYRTMVELADALFDEHLARFPDGRS